MLHCSASCMLPKARPPLAVASCRVIPFDLALTSSLRVSSREGLLTAASGSLAVLCMATTKKRKRYRTPYPGEAKGIVEEMRFVGMKLRNNDIPNVKQRRQKHKQQQQEAEEEMDDEDEEEEEEEEEGGKEEDEEEEGRKEEDEEGELEVEEEGGINAEVTWQPSVEGYLKYLVDSMLVFDTLDKTVDEATDVAYADFRRIGLDFGAIYCSFKTQCFSQQGYLLPGPSSPGVSYAKYLREISEASPPGFLSHFYNIYFAHISGGQVIGKQQWTRDE